jgi:hypothetical protein
MFTTSLNKLPVSARSNSESMTFASFDRRRDGRDFAEALRGRSLALEG